MARQCAMPRWHPAGDCGALTADEDEVFVHSFYWDVLQDPALTMQVRASNTVIRVAHSRHGRCAALPCQRPIAPDYELRISSSAYPGRLVLTREPKLAPLRPSSRSRGHA